MENVPPQKIIQEICRADGKLSQLDKKLRNVSKTAYHKKPTMSWLQMLCASPNLSLGSLLTKYPNGRLDELVRFGRKFGSKASKNQEKSNKNSAEDDQLSHNGTTGAKIGPHHATLSDIFLELVCTKLVINESSKSNAVAKSLEKSHWVTEEEHGSEDEKDVLEYTRQSKDER